MRREAGGAALTPAGELLLVHADAALERVRLAEHELRAHLERGAEALRIGTSPTSGALLLPPAVKEVHLAGVDVSLTGLAERPATVRFFAVHNWPVKQAGKAPIEMTFKRTRAPRVRWTG